MARFVVMHMPAFLFIMASSYMPAFLFIMASLYMPAFLLLWYHNAYACVLAGACISKIYACVICCDVASGLRSPLAWLGLMALRVMGMAWPLWPACYWRWLGPCYGPAFHLCGSALYGLHFI